MAGLTARRDWCGSEYLILTVYTSDVGPGGIVHSRYVSCPAHTQPVPVTRVVTRGVGGRGVLRSVRVTTETYVLILKIK